MQIVGLITHISCSIARYNDENNRSTNLPYSFIYHGRYRTIAVNNVAKKKINVGKYSGGRGLGSPCSELRVSE